MERWWLAGINCILSIESVCLTCPFSVHNIYINRHVNHLTITDFANRNHDKNENLIRVESSFAVSLMEDANTENEEEQQQDESNPIPVASHQLDLGTTSSILLYI